MADPTSLNGLVGDPRALPDNMSISQSGEPMVENMGPGNVPPSSGGSETTMPATDPNLATRGNNVSGVNVGATSASIVNDASGFLDKKGATMSDQVSDIDADTAGTSIDSITGDPGALNVAASTAAVDTASQVSGNNQASTYDAKTTAGQVNDALADAATMETNEDAIVDADELTMDMQGMATGINEDGSINATGAALNEFAHQNISRVIDTSTVAGKLLAQTLGEGNYTDAKATVKGQLDILTKEFVDSEGNPKIPSWAAGIARNVGRTFAFKGVTGTAAMSAMSTAMIEATLPIAQADSSFYQTLTIKNLDNKQQMIINKANVLSKMELANLDVRTSVAVNNAKTFMQYDMANLANEQQANIVNTQAKVQAILEDAKQVNVARRFNAESQNDMDMFYDNLSSTIDMYNTGQKNQMSQFNAGELNDTFQFNATLENGREQFYANMQYQVDAANAKWRQTVTLQNNENEFNAAAIDVKNIVGLTTEALNQLWDRADSLLDYAWKEGENEKDRELKLEMAKMELQAARDAAQAKKKGGIFGAIGSIAGSLLGSSAGSSAAVAGIGKVAGFAAKVLPFFSDEKLKTNIRQYGKLPSGAGLFEWEWTEEAVKLGADKLPTYGVIAQDLKKHIPEAVRVGKNGFLVVDYEKVA